MFVKKVRRILKIKHCHCARVQWYAVTSCQNVTKTKNDKQCDKDEKLNMPVPQRPLCIAVLNARTVMGDAFKTGADISKSSW